MQTRILTSNESAEHQGFTCKHQDFAGASLAECFCTWEFPQQYINTTCQLLATVCWRAERLLGSRALGKLPVQRCTSFLPPAEREEDPERWRMEAIRSPAWAEAGSVTASSWYAHSAPPLRSAVMKERTGEAVSRQEADNQITEDYCTWHIWPVWTRFLCSKVRFDPWRRLFSVCLCLRGRGEEKTKKKLSVLLLFCVFSVCLYSLYSYSIFLLHLSPPLAVTGSLHVGRDC